MDIFYNKKNEMQYIHGHMKWNENKSVLFTKSMNLYHVTEL